MTANTAPSAMLRTLGAATLATVAFLLAACTDEPAVNPTIDEDAFVFDRTEIVVDVPVITPTATRVPPSNEAKAGGVLMIEADLCGVFDPAVDFSESGGFDTLRTVHEMHAGLVRVTNQRPPGIELELASSYEASDDGTRYEFVLRPGLKFSDGSPLLASDVVYSWERALRKSTAPSEARDIFGRVVGFDEFLANPRGNLAGLTVIDDRRLIVELATPDPEFLFRIARPAGYVVSQKDAPAWDHVFVNSTDNPGNSFENTLVPATSLPIGAGPFALVEYADPRQTFGDSGLFTPSTDQCVLVRNEHYWQPDRPRLDAIVAYVSPYYWEDHDRTLSRQVDGFTAGDLDVASHNAIYALATTGSTVDRAIVDATYGFSLRLLVFNPDLPPTDFVESRRALAAAVATFLPFTLSRATNLVPELLLPPNVEPPRPDWRYSTYTDPSTDFGLSGASIEYYTFFQGTGYVPESVFEAWSDDLGVNVSVLLDYYGDGGPEPPHPERQLLDVDMSTTSPLISTALNAALRAFGDADAPAEFRELIAELENAEMHADPVSRLEKYLSIEKELLDQAYVLPLIAEVDEWDVALQQWVKGFETSPFGGTRFADIWLTTDAPDRAIPMPAR